MSFKKKKAKRHNKNREIQEDLQESINNQEEYLPEPPKKNIKLNNFNWTEKQKEFFKIALDKGTRIMLITGPAGTSKTFLSVYCGLQLINSKVVNDIMYVRSAVESSAQGLGFLPGTAEDKLRFYNLPFLDKMDELLAETRAEKLEKEGRISTFPINYARGMNWKSKFVILDEAQNSTYKEIITILTRLGDNSICFVLADPMQTDLKNYNQHGGFEYLMEIFNDEESKQMGVQTFRFSEEDIMRSELVKFLVKKINTPAK